MKATQRIGAWAFASMVIAGGVAFGAQGPGKINYQGVLRDAAGKPRAGSFDMVFRFYDQLAGGNELLVDRHEAAGAGAVAVTTGLFSAALGGGTIEDGAGPGTYASLRDVFARNDAVYLEVTVEGETLSPRTQMLSSAFSIGNLKPDGPCFDYISRFVDCNNGTVTDTRTGLVWLKDANCGVISPRDFVDANNAAAGLHSGQCGLTDGSTKGDWRLPTYEEWQGIWLSGCSPNPGGPTILDKTGYGCYLNGTPWASGVQSDYYWSSSTYRNNSAGPANLAWLAGVGTGYFYSDGKSTPRSVWPVRSPR